MQEMDLNKIGERARQVEKKISELTIENSKKENCNEDDVDQLDQISVFSNDQKENNLQEEKQETDKSMCNITQIGLNLLKQNLNPRKDELILTQLPQIRQFTLKQVQQILKPKKTMNSFGGYKENNSK